MASGNGLGRAIGALEGTAVDRTNRQESQSLGDLHSLRLSHGTQGIIAGTDVAEFTVGEGFAVTNEKEPGGGHYFFLLTEFSPFRPSVLKSLKRIPILPS